MTRKRHAPSGRFLSPGYALLALCACSLDLNRELPRTDIGADIAIVVDAAPRRDLPVDHAIDGQHDVAPVDLRDAQAPRKWTIVVTNTEINLDAIHGADGAIWAVGADTILRGDVNGWSTKILAEAHRLTGVWAASASQAWIVDDAGDTGIIFASTSAGAQWTAQRETTPDLTGIWGRTTTDIWVIGDSELVLHFNGQWSISHDPIADPQAQLEDIWASSPDNAWAVRPQYLYHFAGGKWSRQDNPDGLMGIWGRSASEIWAVGSKILKYSGSGWQSEPMPTSTALRDVWGCPDGDVWAVGNAGKVLRRTKTAGWVDVPLQLGDLPNLYAVFCDANNAVWAAGAKGTLLRYGQ